jgi:hypothetical protein
MVTDYFAGSDLRRRRTSGLLKMPSLSRLESSDMLIAGWCSSVLQPFFEMSDFIVAQLIPGKGGPRVSRVFRQQSESLSAAFASHLAGASMAKLWRKTCFYYKRWHSSRKKRQKNVGPGSN